MRKREKEDLASRELQGPLDLETGRDSTVKSAVVVRGKFFPL
jgi:hypothetical protein